MAMRTEAKVLLGSATPAIETFYNAQTGKYGYVPLTQRYGDAVLPEIQMVNISDLRRKKNGSFLSPLLIREIEDRLQKNEQIILFQNRRGFSPYVECKDCGWIPQCEHCSVSLTYHKRSNSLVCHYCGYSIPVQHSCLACGSSELSTKGFGTEKVEEELQVIFPQTVVERMDLDTTRSRSAYQRIITDFESRKIQILVGTQMITKGLDFDNVSLVGVLNADGMLSFPDFRSAERSFQLIQQVAGRAGRRNQQGLVLVQTGMPLHPVLQQVQANDYAGMYAQQLDERCKFAYPPFSRLIRVTLKHRDQAVLFRAAEMLSQLLRPVFAERVLGPEVPLINRVQNLYLINFLLKLDLNRSLQHAKQTLRQQFETLRRHEKYKAIIITVDVDAYA
jgi:primosomal protein N' (replication factor Y)